MQKFAADSWTITNEYISNEPADPNFLRSFNPVIGKDSENGLHVVWSARNSRNS